MSRSLWKPLPLYNNIISNQQEKNFIFKRNQKIYPLMLHQTIKIHNGIKFFEIIVNEKMIGLKCGEFAPTRKFPLHKKKKK